MRERENTVTSPFQFLHIISRSVHPLDSERDLEERERENGRPTRLREWRMVQSERELYGIGIL